MSLVIFFARSTLQPTRVKDVQKSVNRPPRAYLITPKTVYARFCLPRESYQNKNTASGVRSCARPNLPAKGRQVSVTSSTKSMLRLRETSKSLAPLQSKTTCKTTSRRRSQNSEKLALARGCSQVIKLRQLSMLDLRQA